MIIIGLYYDVAFALFVDNLTMDLQDSDMLVPVATHQM